MLGSGGGGCWCCCSTVMTCGGGGGEGERGRSGSRKSLGRIGELLVGVLVVLVLSLSWETAAQSTHHGGGGGGGRDGCVRLTSSAIERWSLTKQEQHHPPRTRSSEAYYNLCSFLPDYLSSKHSSSSSSSSSSSVSFSPSRSALFALAPNQTKEEMVFNSRLVTEGFKLLSSECREAAVALACPSLLPQCYQPVQRAPGVPQSVCRRTCESMVEKCGSEFEARGVPLPNCTETDSTGAPIYPSRYSTFLAGNSTFRVPCLNISAEEVPQEEDEFVCPEPLIFDPHKPVAPCNLPCPSPLYSDFEYDFFRYLTAVLAVLGFAGTCFVSITYGVNPRLRRMPGALVFWVSTPLCIFEISQLLLFASKETECNGITDPGDRTNAMVFAQSFLKISGGGATLLWYITLAANLYVMLHFDYVVGWKVKALALIVCNFWGLGMWVGGISTNNIAASGFGADMAATPFVRGFYITATICCVLGVLLSLPLTYLIGKAKLNVGNSRSRMRRWVGMVRVFTYVVYYIGVVSVLIATNYYAEANQDEIQQGVVDWVGCSVRLLEADCKDKHLLRVPFGLFIAIGVLTTFSGVVLFFCFGTSEEALHWWKELILHGRLVTSWSSAMTTQTLTKEKDPSKATTTGTSTLGGGGAAGTPTSFGNISSGGSSIHSKG